MSLADRIRKSWKAEAGYSELFRIAIPLVISTGSWSVQHFVDGIFLARYSKEAIAAVVPAGIFLWTVLSIFSGTATYVNTFVAQYTGAKMDEKVGPAVWQGVFVAVLAGLFMIAVLPPVKVVFGMFGRSAVVQEMKFVYYKTMCFGAAFIVLNGAFSGFFSGRGDTKTVMWVNIAGIGVNIPLDYVLIFGKAGFPEMGIEGAALATVIGVLTSSVLFIVLFLRRRYRKRYNTVAGCRFDVPLFKRLIRYGLPNGLHWFLDMSAFTVFMLLVENLGTDEIAATNISIRINTLAFMPMIGFGLAVSTLVGQYLGKNRPDLARRQTYSAFKVTLSYMTLVAISYVALPGFFTSLFTGNAFSGDLDRVAGFVKVLLRFVAVFTVFDSINIIFSNAIKGAGDTRFVMWTTVSLAWGLMAIPTYLAISVFGQGIYTVWCFLSGYIIIVSAVFYSRFRGGKWESMRVIEAPAQIPAPLPDSPTVGVETAADTIAFLE